MAEKRTLLKGGDVLTMDPDLGDLTPGDVLIEGRKIVAVDRALDAQADEIVDLTGHVILPGLIDSHIHLWQTPLRGVAAETFLGDYFPLVHPLSGRYRSQDMYAATYGGAIELLMGGVTTVFDFCHSVNSPHHADASVDALQDAGVRALFGYSFCDRPEVANRAFGDHSERLRDARRVRAERLSSDDALVRMAIALNNINHVPDELNAAEMACARELGVIATVHSTSDGQIADLHKRSLLGPDLMWVHGNAATDEELAYLASDGGSIAVAPEIEVGLGGDYLMTGRCVRRGIPTTFGVDIVSAVSGELIFQLRLAFQAERMHDVQFARLYGRGAPHIPTLTPRRVLELATVDAAKALGLDARTGSLTPGKEADVLVLSTEPFGVSIGDLASHVILQSSRANVDRVYVAGTERVCRGQPLDVDVKAMRAALDDARAHIFPPRAPSLSSAM